MNRDFEGVWIPKEVFLSRDIGLAEKLYYSIYLQCEDIKETENILSVTYSDTTIYNAKSRLIEAGLVRIIETPEDAKNYVLSKKWKGEYCEWCGERSYILHEHHYPISKASGGTEIVRICPNCHCAYHAVYKESFNEQSQK